MKIWSMHLLKDKSEVNQSIALFFKTTQRRQKSEKICHKMLTLTDKGKEACQFQFPMPYLVSVSCLSDGCWYMLNQMFSFLFLMTALCDHGKQGYWLIYPGRAL